MKIRINNQIHNQGSVLLVTLLTAVIMGITLASYLTMVQAQNKSVARSQTWNSSISVTEAGIEEGLALINKYSGNLDLLTNWMSTYASDGWDNPASGVYHIQRYVGSSSNYYDVYVTNFANGPSIHSIGNGSWAALTSLSVQPPIFAAAGVNVSTPSRITRRVDVQTKMDAIFNAAMAALYTIDFKGNNVTTDSFDSWDANYSTGGLYPYGNVNKTKANGDVYTDYTVINSLSVGNANIKGHVKTGPKGTVDIGPNGTVGDRAWVEGGSTGIKPGYFADDMNVLFNDVSLPTGVLWLPANHTSGGNNQVNGVAYDFIFTSGGDFTISSSGGGLSGSSGGIYVGTNVTVRLKITTSVSLSGQSEIHIAPGGRLEIYMVAPSFSLMGNGLVNENGNASSFYYFGLPSNTSVAFGGNGTFVGAIYAPEANFTLGGGGVNTIDFVGASVTRTVTMNGKYNFHYDEDLRRHGPGRGYIPTNWKES